MKKITLLFIVCLTLSFSSSSQTTAIPDTNFEQALIDAGFDSDGIINGQILTADATAVTGELNLDDKNITDFTGVKAFTGIDVLSCKGNPNTTLDISGMTNINTFAVENNLNLTSVNTSGCSGLQYLFATLCPVLNTINVSSNAALLRLYFYDTVVSSIDVSDCVVLDRFYCYSSSLTTLDVSNNPVLTRLRTYSNANLTSLDVRSGGNTVLTDFQANDNSSLTCINVDDVTYSTTNWTNIDSGVVFSTSCSTASTAIPNSNFEQALIDAGFDSDGIINGQILTADAAAVTGELNLDDKNITDFTGVKAFTGIDVLSCKGNPNTTLDISGMTNINTFAVENNPNLTSVNTSGCTGLQYLFTTLCPVLNTINVSGNAALLRLYFYNTVVSSIDVSDCVVLDRFYCYSSSLTTLDVSNNPVLTRLRTYSNANLTSLDVRSGGNTVLADFQANDNSSLTCINVDDVAYSTTNWTIIDAGTVFNTDCNTLSTENFETLKYSLYPNPIKGNKVTLKSESEGTYVIYNIIGKEVKKDVLISGENVLNTSQLNTGIYIILINDNFGASKSVKIVKE